mmetsp:Transcript_18581/g.40242  ORF Transcript_18581/g.40242 Transcript_18581/m.40242 type:complete len:716 (-) Transcript_18581:49-2196(-)
MPSANANSVAASACWPTDDANAALLLTSTSSTNTSADREDYCRVEYRIESGLIRIVTCPSPGVKAANGADGSNNIGTTGRILDEIDPSDIIGADLEVRFEGDDSNASCGNARNIDDNIAPIDGGQVITSHGWVGSVLNGVRASASVNGNDAAVVGDVRTGSNRGGDAEAGSGYVSGRTSPISSKEVDEVKDISPAAFQSELSAALGGILASDVTNTALPSHPSEGDVPVSPRRRNRNSAVAYLNIYCYPRPKPKGRGGLWNVILGSNSKEAAEVNKNGNAADPTKHLAHRRPHHRRYEVAPTEDFMSIRSVVRAIRTLAMLGKFESQLTSSSPPRTALSSTSLHRYTGIDGPRRYLVVVNPYSGTGRGVSIYEETVRPMLEQAGVEHDVCTTERAGHARERMANVIEGSLNGSGSVKDEEAEGKERDISEYDALIAMGGDGILWEMLQGIMSRSDGQEVLQKVAIGIVGCGTSNGLAKSILHQSMAKYSPLESTFLICKGRTAHVDLSRYETICGRTYTGFLTFSWAFIADVDIDSECIRCLGSLRNDIWAAYRIIANRSYKAKFSYLPQSAVEDTATSKAVTLPPLGDPVPTSKGWKTIEGDFILFWASQVTHAAYNTFQSPLSQMQDGLFRIMVVRKPISRLEMIQIALAIETGHHVHHTKCEMYECVAYRLEPLVEGGGSSHNDLDGEKIEDGPIQACVLPGAARFFSAAMT